MNQLSRTRREQLDSLLAPDGPGVGEEEADVMTSGQPAWERPQGTQEAFPSSLHSWMGSPLVPAKRNFSL